MDTGSPSNETVLEIPMSIERNVVKHITYCRVLVSFHSGSYSPLYIYPSENNQTKRDNGQKEKMEMEMKIKWEEKCDSKWKYHINWKFGWMRELRVITIDRKRAMPFTIHSTIISLWRIKRKFYSLEWAIERRERGRNPKKKITWPKEMD